LREWYAWKRPDGVPFPSTGVNVGLEEITLVLPLLLGPQLRGRLSKLQGISIEKPHIHGERLLDRYCTNLIPLSPRILVHSRFHWSMKIIDNVPEARVCAKTTQKTLPA